MPWVVSFWVDDTWWKLGLWLFGLALTLTYSVFGGRADQEELLARLDTRLPDRSPRGAPRGGPRRGRERPRQSFVAARIDAGHLGERLGLFVIIVLGEAMLQLVGAVAEIEDWRPGGGEGWLLLLTVVSAFGLLVALWGLNTSYGFAEESRFPPSLVLPAHFVAIASITTIAAGLGSAAAGVADHLAASTTWLMCGGAAAFLLVVNLLVAHTRRWPLRAVAVALPLAAAVAGPWLPAAVLVTVMAVAASGLLWLLRASRRIPSGT